MRKALSIGIDARILATDHFSGIKTYTANLLTALSKIDKVNRYIVYSPTHVPIPKQANFFLHVTPVRVPILRSVVFQQIVLPYVFRSQSIDVFHFLSNTMPLILPKTMKTVLTVHDVIDFLPLEYARNMRYLALRWYQKLVMPINMTRAHSIIVPSVSVKKTVTDLIHVQQEKIHVIPEGVSSEFYPSSKRDLRMFWHTHRFTAPPFMTIASFSPRKNAFMVLEAYARMPSYLRSVHKLVIVLSYEPLKQRLFDLARRYHVSRDIRILSNLSPWQLRVLYGSALVLVFPSSYEGFGLPVIEAMACKTPVILSAMGALPEIARAEGIYLRSVDVSEVNSKMRYIYNLFTNHSKVYRMLQSRAQARAKQYDWEICAKKTLHLYEQTAAD